MNWKGIAGFVFIGSGFLFTIISMATLGWIVWTHGDAQLNIGLVQYQACNDGTCTTRSLSDEGDDTYVSRGAQGGKQVIAVGIVSLVVALAGVVCLYMSHKKESYAFRAATVACWLVAGALCILAVILYAKATVKLNYAFILYLFSSFTALLGCCAVLAGPGVKGGAPGSNRV